DDNSDETVLTFHASARIRLGESVIVDAGGTYKTSTSENYASISDLLGGNFHEDKDPFTDTENDINGEILKYKGDTFNYDYSIYAKQAQGFVQLQAERKKWNAFFAANLGYTGYQREGHFLNERFAANSLGKSDALKFSDYGVKAGGQYHITGRHTLS